VIEHRRADPGEDMISSLATAEVDGERLDDEIIHGFLRLLVPAGAGTTYRLLGSLLFGLLTHIEQIDEVIADRSVVPRAIEEALRWESPVQFAMREAIDATELDGVAIPKGATVTVALGSANHDDDRYDDPERFDVHRNGGPHLAFGDGPHRCLGEHLARVEARAALNALLDRLRDVRLDPGEDDPHIVGYAFRSPTAVPVRFTPER
jgi:cytochrome P450